MSDTKPNQFLMDNKKSKDKKSKDKKSSSKDKKSKSKETKTIKALKKEFDDWLASADETANIGKESPLHPANLV